MNKLFASAVWKLTAWFVGALVLILLTFSLPIFAITSDRLERSSMRQSQILRQYQEDFGMMAPFDQMDMTRQAQLTQDRNQLIMNILIEDLLILIIGGVASYLFAKRTLQPIEEAHAAQGAFTANASHQLRTPLATLQAEVEVALRDKKLTLGEARRVLQSNLEEVDRLRTLSDQLLMLTRDAGSVDASKVDVGQLVDRFVSKHKKQYRLVATAKPAKGHVVMADRALLEEVLKILCENAQQYSGGKEVNLNFKPAKGSAMISVQDQGPGMTELEQVRVFDRFYRGKEASTMHPAGHGLGLSLARAIVERFDGELTVRSALGKGATFTISLPLAVS